jgi:hypothetical protein
MRQYAPEEGSPREAVRRLRVGLVLDGRSPSGWQQVVIDRLHGEAGVALAAIIERADTGRGWMVRCLWEPVNAVEAGLARLACTRLLAGAASLTERAARLEDVAWYREEALITDAARRLVLAADLDVIIDLTAGHRSSDLSGLAKLGTWALRSECGSYDRVTPLGFQEFYRGEPTCSISIVCATTGSQIASGSYRTFPWSWNLNALFLAANVSLLLTDSLKHAAERPTTARSVPGGKHRERGESGSPRHAAPSLMQAVLAPAISGVRVIVESFRRATFEDRWQVVLSEVTSEPAGAPVVLESPLSSFWADPFVIRREGRCCIFLEEYLYAEKRGVISCVDLASGPLQAPLAPPATHRVLDCPHHLSYPFLFERDDRLFMIPESSHNRTVELWECVEFPEKWEKRRNLLEDISAVDSSLLEWRGRWWLFTNVDRTGLGDHCNELHVFHCSDPLTGAWQPHARNPVVVDSRRARMAGGFLFTAGGRPVRCCQVQGARYGEGIAYGVVDELSETEYSETPTDVIVGPIEETSVRHHHISCRHGLIVADRCRETLKLKRILGALWVRQRERQAARRGGRVDRSEARRRIQQAE